MNPGLRPDLTPLEAATAQFDRDSDGTNPTVAMERVRSLTYLVESLFSRPRTSSENGHIDFSPTLEFSDTASQLLSLILDGPDAVIILDCQHGTIIETSRRFEEWTGIPRESVIGTLFLDLFPTTERVVARTLFESAGTGAHHVIELPSARPGLRSRLIEFTSAQTSRSRALYAVIIGRDVGERAATERYLRAERDRLNLFIRAMRDLLVLLLPNGEVLYANPAAEQTFEPVQLTLVCQRWLNEFAKQHPFELQGHVSAYEGQTLELEDHTGRVFLVTRSFLFDAGRQPTVMLVAKDITEQRRIEDHSHQLQIQYMRENKLAEFGMFSAGIAHNLNGPLQVVLGYCDLLELRMPGLPEIAQMRDQALTMRDIVANLMQKSRSEQESQPRDLRLEDIIMSELRFSEANMFFKHHVKKVVEFQPDSPPLYGVYIDFSQVIGNLIRNATDAMRESESRILTVKTVSDGKYLSLIVSDTGGGMSADVKRNLFTPFFTTKPKYAEAAPGEPTGTGLGLSTCRNILSRYGATITVGSEPGNGATFTVSFPLNRKPPP